MRERAAGLVALLSITLVLIPAPARSAECAHAVVVALPGMTWRDVQRYRPPALLELFSEGAAGSVSVRTNSARTSYASGFATIGAGARVDGGRTTGAVQATSSGAPAPAGRDGRLATDVVAGGVGEIGDMADEQGYGAEPGALARALAAPVVALGNADAGRPAPAPIGGGRWALYAAMGPSGVVDAAATEPGLLDRDASAPFGVRTNPVALEDALGDAMSYCGSTVIVDPGDLERVDQAALADASVLGDPRAQAIASADALVGHVASRLDAASDLLLVTSVTSPWWDPHSHLGIAIARGPGFHSGEVLESASTRRSGFVTLPDVAPTVLGHMGVPVPAEMNGRAWESQPGRVSIAELVDEDAEAAFVDSLQGPISTGFVVFQVVVYVLAIVLLASRRRGRSGHAAGLLEGAALLIVAFPVSTYLVGCLNGHGLGTVWFVIALCATAIGLTGVTALLVERPLDRLLALAAFTVAVIGFDLVLGGNLQIETVFGYSPIVAGRFAGIGNISFAVLSASALLTGTLLVHRKGGGGALALAGALFAAVVVLDGAPQLGSDVGGVVALVPGLGITLVLLSGRRPSWRMVLGFGAIAVALLGVFLAIDLARPPESQTHLARLFDDVRARGLGAFGETVRRKAEANLRVFRTSIWTLFVPPALGVLTWLLLRPRGRWRELAHAYPKLRSGLVGGLVLAVLAFAVNDSGIVIPAVILSFLVPMALMVHLSIEAAPSAEEPA